MKHSEAQAKWLGTEWYEGKPWSRITRVVPASKSGCRFFILLIGTTGDYDVVGIMDRDTGENRIPGRCRPADSIDDAVDVAMEMLETR